MKCRATVASNRLIAVTSDMESEYDLDSPFSGGPAVDCNSVSTTTANRTSDAPVVAKTGNVSPPVEGRDKRCSPRSETKPVGKLSGEDYKAVEPLLNAIVKAMVEADLPKHKGMVG